MRSPVAARVFIFGLVLRDSVTAIHPYMAAETGADLAPSIPDIPTRLNER
jgi:hypothetical protein